MPHIRFRFAPEKLVQALAYFSHRGVRDLDKMKAPKLLFHADKYHLLTYGRPVMNTSGRRSAWELNQESHNEPSWKIANESRPPGSSVIMDYRLFFEGHPEAADMLRFVEAQQEDRDSAEELATRRTLHPERLAGACG